MKKLNIGFLILSILATSGYCFFLKFSSSPNLILTCLWLALPPLLLILITLKSPRFFKTVNNSFYVSLAVVASGLYFLLDVTFINPDPQGAIAVYMLPVFQVIEIVLLGIVFKTIFRR